MDKLIHAMRFIATKPEALIFALVAMIAWWLR
jgi:hypothetical protein